MDDKNAPLYSFTYRPSYDDIRRFGRRLRGWRWWRNDVFYNIFLAIEILLIISNICISLITKQISWLGIVWFLVILAVWIVVAVRYNARYISEYEKDRAAEAGFLSTYTFYMDRVEVEGPEGRLTHAYTAYDELDLYPEMFYLLIFANRGEHLPWTVVPENQRENFRDFLIDRAQEYGVPVNDRVKKKKQRY